MPAADLTVRAVMDTTPVTVPPTATVQDVLDVMNQRRIGSVLVVEDGRLAGIFTDRDLLKRVAADGPPWRAVPVTAWMTTTPHTVGPDVGWDEAVGLMSRRRVRHLPVIEDGKLIGLVSTRLLMARRDEYLNKRIAESTAELRRANETLLARDTESTYNLRAAGELQKKLLLPHQPPDWAELRWAVHYAPLDHLGGDYYDFARPTQDQLGVLIADASGHSLPAAMVAIMARVAFAEAAGVAVWPGEVLAVMNRRLHELTGERFVTACYGLFDRASGAFRYANAGHPHPLLFRAATGEVVPLAAAGFLLGVMPDEVYQEKQVTLAVGDRVVFFTDGLVESRNEIGELYGVSRLTASVAAHGRRPLADMKSAILHDQRAFNGDAPETDDVTLAIAEVLGG